MTNKVISLSDYKGSNIEKSFTQNEGSRGGKIIGHTRSGNPIYDTANHPSHVNFSAADHEDALRHHSTQFSIKDKAAGQHYATGNKNEAVAGYRDRDKHHAAINEHRQALYSHYVKDHPSPVHNDSSNKNLSREDHLKAIEEHEQTLKHELPVVDSKNKPSPLTRAQHIKRAHIEQIIHNHHQAIKDSINQKESERRAKVSEDDVARLKRLEEKHKQIEEQGKRNRAEREEKAKNRVPQEHDPYRRADGGRYMLD